MHLQKRKLRRDQETSTKALLPVCQNALCCRHLSDHSHNKNYVHKQGRQSGDKYIYIWYNYHYVIIPFVKTVLSFTATSRQIQKYKFKVSMSAAFCSINDIHHKTSTQKTDPIHQRIRPAHRTGPIENAWVWTGPPENIWVCPEAHM
ncbi:hypothetical protein NL108_008054 [Boleophthalmus pectinirostris]|nr:hypothetical protein NL108_008054 [Boleophthalmus pectinirostris]